MNAPADPAVARIVAAGGPELPGRLRAVEERLAALATGHGDVLGEHAGATIAAGGKRLRPLLVLLAAGPDGPLPDAVRAATAVELLHSATLVHDDVLDAAPLRRGRPTVVATAGRTLATATGDLLFSRAFAELVLNGSAEQVRELSAASSALAHGELVQREDAFRAVGVERYLHRCELKTGRLFAAACALGALLASRPTGRSSAFGRRIGLAFQLLDDVLDVSGPAERTGKHRGTDLLDGTITLPFILARERDAALAAIDPAGITSPERAEEVCDRIAATGALDEARGRALTMVEEAKHDPPDDRPVWGLVADSVVARYS